MQSHIARLALEIYRCRIHFGGIGSPYNSTRDWLQAEKEIIMAGKKNVVAVTPTGLPTHDEIAIAANDLWKKLGCPEGYDESVNIWLKAEQTLLTEIDIDKKLEV